jgi:hypothetical protein
MNYKLIDGIATFLRQKIYTSYTIYLDKKVGY